jgi:hypothetical protein
MEMSSLISFFVDKSSHTFSDELTAFGFMRVLQDLHLRQGTDGYITLYDDGDVYRITCALPILAETLESLRQQPLWIGNAKLIVTVKNASKLSDDVSMRVLFEDVREQKDLYFAALNKAQDKTSPPVEYPAEWETLRAINTPLALPGYTNLLTDWWKARPAHPELFQLLLDLFSESPNDAEKAAAAWKQIDKAHGFGIDTMTTCQQLYNPDQGKGQNRSKASGMSIGNIDGFWLVEWLKLIGFYETAITRQVRGAKDRKTFVVVPRKLSYAENSAILKKFAENMRYAETSTKFDILAAIRYVNTVLQYFAEQKQREGFRRARTVKQLVSGFHTAFYKDLGNAVATMNVSFIGLPGWVEIHESADVKLYQGMLKELETLVSFMDEEHSDAFNLLQDLRDFVSGDDLTAFFRFTNAFPAYLMGKREQGKRVSTLTTDFIERLIMTTEKQYADILASEGFQNIAYAIRQSTVTAQYRKKQGDRKYDVRYGLGQQLARKARYKDEFIAELGDFLFKYNAENAQVMETRNGPFRKSVRTTDIDEIVALIDRFGSQTVANLLIAYGYARVPRDAEYDLENGDIETNTEEIAE